MTSGTDRPWWASEPGISRPEEDPDPMTRHRAARAGEGATGGPHGRGSPSDRDPEDDDGNVGADASSLPPWWESAAAAVSRLSEDLAAGSVANASSSRPAWDDAPPPTAPGPDGDQTRDPGAHGPDVCGVCPICVGLRALGASRPELVSHLTEAARHLAAAVRTVVEQQAAPDAGGADDDGLTRIDLDDDVPGTEP